MDKVTLLIAQIFMTFLMSLTMSGIMIFLHMGLSAEAFGIWLWQFPVAWPIAFVVTQIWSRVAFPLAFIIRAKTAKKG